jgi:hypothetical protein
VTKSKTRATHVLGVCNVMKRKTRSDNKKKKKKSLLNEVSGDTLLLENGDPDETGFIIVENSVFDIKNVTLLKEKFSKQKVHNVIHEHVNTKVKYDAFRKQLTLYMTKNIQALSFETTNLYDEAKPAIKVPLVGTCNQKSLGSIYKDFSNIIRYLKVKFGDSFNDNEVAVSILKSIRGGKKQGDHRDFLYSDLWDDNSLIKQKNFQESPKSLLFCVDDYLKIGVYPGSHKNAPNNEVIINLKKGQAIIFHSELVHYGCGYDDSDNHRVHFYIDNLTILRPPETSYFIRPEERINNGVITVVIDDSSDDDDDDDDNNTLLPISRLLTESVDAVPEVPKKSNRRSRRFNILTVEIFSDSDEDGDDFCIAVSQPNIYASLTTK